MTTIPHPSAGYRSSPSGDDVVLVDELGRPIGLADRTTIHTASTPLHLAFSAYLFDPDGRVLLTRRALTKATWPGVWTNSCCGHPRPGEDLEAAARRRIREELGLTVDRLVPLLPDFRYRAIDASGIVENEICPVFAGRVDDPAPTADPGEVAEWAWVPWPDLVAAVAATPQVYSPWATQQVPLIAATAPERSLLASSEPDENAAIHDVDELLRAEIAALTAEWDDYAGALGADVLPADLPAWLADLLIGRGKRRRTALAYWGYVAAGGRHGTAEYRRLVRVAAALETLHLFALVHDDVMDDSASRRGRPSAHMQAAQWHRQAGALGEAALFGRNLAILIGDLAHTIADRFVAPLPPSLRAIWYALSVELIAGQRADLSGAAAGRRDRRHAEHVGRVKSGRYTVVRPLQLGAAAAGATPSIIAALTDCGDQLGRAFALRDDYLGVWGDPALTGKPAGDDLFEAKATVLVCLAQERLTGRDAALLDSIGTPAFGRQHVAELAAAMRAAGIDLELERMIDEAVAAAFGSLQAAGLSAAGVAGLREAGRGLAWRDA